MRRHDQINGSKRWIVSTAAEQVPREKLHTFRSRLEGNLRHKINVSDDDVADACAAAKIGLVQAMAS
jgi:hypothetical protein